jgi:hypothetical protein
MQESAVVNGAPPVPVAPTNGQPWAAAPVLLFTQERLRELVAALEEPFDVAEIKWRVRIQQVLPWPGHGIAAMSKVMPSVRASAIAAAHFPKDRHQVVSSPNREPSVIYASRNQERSLRSALLLHTPLLRCGRMVDRLGLSLGSSPLGSILLA